MFLFQVIPSLFIKAHLMNFLGNSFTWKLWIFLIFFIIFLYIFFFLLQISFLTQIVLPEVKMGHFCENIPQGLQENSGLLMCKTCSHFSMAHSIIRKTLGSSPGPYSIWKEVKFSLFEQNACPSLLLLTSISGETEWGKFPPVLSPCTSDYSTAMQT